MSIVLEPAELGFRRPFTHEVTQTLKLGNKSSHPLAFKVKTTAPKQYCVRPNSGRIESGNEVEVQVLLQAMKEEPAPDAKCRDKFLVQSISITPERDIGTVPSIWQNVEKIAKDQIEERKIRVVFLPAEGAVSTPNHKQVNGLSGDPPAYETTPSYSSPAQQAVTPNTRSVPEDSKSGTNYITNAASAAYAGASTVATSVSNAVPTSGEDFKAQLAEAKQQIQALQAQIQDQGLRQRKSDAVNQDARERITTGTTGLGVQQQSSDGVPVQMVAALCLLSFLLAYFFF